jgi:hypothetical protein
MVGHPVDRGHRDAPGLVQPPAAFQSEFRAVVHWEQVHCRAASAGVASLVVHPLALCYQQPEPPLQGAAAPLLAVEPVFPPEVLDALAPLAGSASGSLPVAQQRAPREPKELAQELLVSEAQQAPHAEQGLQS